MSQITAPPFRFSEPERTWLERLRSLLNPLLNKFSVNTDGQLLIQNIPTSDPGVTGAIWNDSGTLKIS